MLAAQYEAAPEGEKRAIWERYNNLRSCYDLNAEPVNFSRMTAPVMEWVGSVMSSGEAVDWDATLDSIVVPVLLVLGAHDFNTPSAPWVAESPRPGWTIEVFERSAHSPPTEEPNLFVATVARWLETLQT